MSCFMAGGPSKEHKTNKPPQSEEFGNDQKEMPCVPSPLKILLPGIHLG